MEISWLPIFLSTVEYFDIMKSGLGLQEDLDALIATAMSSVLSEMRVAATCAG